MPSLCNSNLSEIEVYSISPCFRLRLKAELINKLDKVKGGKDMGSYICH